MTPTLQYRKQPDLHKSDFFFFVLLSFCSPSTEGYIWFLLLCRIFSAQSIVKKILGCVRVCTDMWKSLQKTVVWSFPCFHLIKFKVANIQTYPSLIDLYTVHRTHSINPLHDNTGPGHRWWKKTEVREGIATMCLERELADKWSASEDDSASRAVLVTLPLICK